MKILRRKDGGKVFPWINKDEEIADLEKRLKLREQRIEELNQWYVYLKSNIENYINRVKTINSWEEFKEFQRQVSALDLSHL